MSMANMNWNPMPTEANTALMVCVLIGDAKGVLTGWMNVEPKRLQALN